MTPPRPRPLVLMLHGYSASGAIQQSYYFKLTATSDAQTFLYAYANGAVGSDGVSFWDATDACCDFSGTVVAEVAHLNGVLDDIMARYNVDPKRVFVVGHSNGGFMAHRLACDAARRIARSSASRAGSGRTRPAVSLTSRCR